MVIPDPSQQGYTAQAQQQSRDPTAAPDRCFGTARGCELAQPERDWFSHDGVLPYRWGGSAADLGRVLYGRLRLDSRLLQDSAHEVGGDRVEQERARLRPAGGRGGRDDDAGAGSALHQAGNLLVVAPADPRDVVVDDAGSG